MEMIAGAGSFQDFASKFAARAPAIR